METATLTISTAARLAGCPENYLRVCEKLGVITPARNSVGQRLYTLSDVEAIKAHRAAKRSGRDAA